MRRLLVFAILLEFTFARSALAQFAHGRFSCPDQQKYLWGGYYGVAWVHGAADQGVSRGTTATFSFIPLRPGGRWMWDIRLGYTQFPRVSGHSNVTAMDVSPNISIVILRSEPSIFVNTGPGVYYIGGRDTKVGFNAGTGVGFPLMSAFEGEISYNYSLAFAPTPTLSLSRLQGGLIVNDPRKLFLSIVAAVRSHTPQ